MCEDKPMNEHNQHTITFPCPTCGQFINTTIGTIARGGMCCQSCQTQIGIEDALNTGNYDDEMFKWVMETLLAWYVLKKQVRENDSKGIKNYDLAFQWKETHEMLYNRMDFFFDHRNNVVGP